MKIDLHDLCGTAVLAGALSGRTILAQLLERAAVEPAAAEPLFLDFAGIEVATASFLRESALALRDVLRGRRSAFYPVVANANAVVREELLELLRPRGDALMCCSLAADGRVVDAAPLGALDPKQRLTYDLVRRHGETDAGALMRRYGASEGVKHTTAWNNRLAALAARGLVIEQSHGRAKRYRPLLQGS